MATKILKQQMQDRLMDRMRTALYDIDTQKEKDEMEKQFRRIEKMFGYNEGSWEFTA
jgi:hypothetical protein